MMLAMALMTAAQVAAPVPADRGGDWSGTLTLESRARLRIAVHIRAGTDGALRGTFDSLDQRAGGAPLDAVAITATTFDFTVPGNGGRYSGRWDARRRRWVGSWSQGGQTWPLSLAAGAPAPMPAPSPGAWTMPSDAEIGDILGHRIAQRPGAAIVVGVIDERGRRIVVRGPARADTLFEIGSITKVFTGLLLADMAARGEVTLDDPVSKYLPVGWTLPVRGRPVTLLDLATHRSGLPRVPLNMPFNDAGSPYADYTPPMMRDFLTAWVPARAPGEAYEYSNLGVGLLGQILAWRAGTDYATLVRARITGPLRMTDTHVRLSGEAMRRLAVPHDEFLRRTQPWDLGVMVAAGGLRSDADDMLTFLGAQLGLVPTPLKPSMDATRIVRAEGERAGSRMGIAWMIAGTRIGEMVTHGGATGGYLTTIAFDPARRRGVVVLANAMTQPGVDDIAAHILTGSPVAATPPPAPAPATRTEIALAPDALDRFSGRYRLAPDVVMTVFRAKNRLLIQLPGQQAVPIYPATPLVFFAKVVPAELTFRMTAGAIDGVTLRQGGEVKLAPRIMP